MTECLVFDVGGTSVRAAVYSRTAGLTKQRRAPAPSFLALPDTGIDELVSALFERLLEMGAALESNDLPAVGVAFPGPVRGDGEVLHAPTLWGDRNATPIDLQSRARERWPGSLVRVVNDMTAAGFHYALDSTDPLCVVTVSSGIGHKVFVDRKPVVGRAGHGGELGHWRIDSGPDAPLCNCGERGHLGALASGRAAAFYVARLERESAYASSPLAGQSEVDPDQLNAQLARAYAEHDPLAEAVVRGLAAPLGKALAGVHLIAGVERFVVIGGLACALGPRYVAEVADAAASHAWRTTFDWSAAIELGAAGDDSGLLGLGRMMSEEANG